MLQQLPSIYHFRSNAQGNATLFSQADPLLLHSDAIKLLFFKIRGVSALQLLIQTFLDAQECSNLLSPRSDA